jgi:hypothetical protein
MEAQSVQAWPAPFRIAGEACGVRALISTDSEDSLERLRELLPPGWVDHDAVAFGREIDAYASREGDDDALQDGAGRIPHFNLITVDGIEYVLKRDSAVLARSGLPVVLDVFDAQLRGYIALHSPDRIFVHAGVVGHRGYAIVFPGPSFSGKTTLVAELVRSGAVYYSDEYAVLDDQGRIHPYPKPLSIRTNAWTATDHDVTTLGGTAGDTPLPLGLIVVAQYRPDAVWQPRKLSSGEAVLALLANTVPARERPEQTMAALRRAVDGSGALALQSERGEASTIVQQVFECVPA